MSGGWVVDPEVEVDLLRCAVRPVGRDVVEAHLGRIYRKLGISSRAELVALTRDTQAETLRADMPVTRYARAGDLSIAYQVIGEGPHDIVLIPGLASHIEILWEQPQWRRFVARIAKLGRLIVFDKRGTGLSDP